MQPLPGHSTPSRQEEGILEKEAAKRAMVGQARGSGRADLAAVVVIDGRALIDLEYSALRMRDHAERNLGRQEVTLALVGLNLGVLAMVRRSELGGRLGTGRLFSNSQEAVERWLADPEAMVRTAPPASPASA